MIRSFFPKSRTDPPSHLLQIFPVDTLLLIIIKKFEFCYNFFGKTMQRERKQKKFVPTHKRESFSVGGIKLSR